MNIFYPQERLGNIRNQGIGLLHLYYGPGVGKTTVAVGLAVRAAGSGLRVVFVQFMKSGTSGEAKAFEKMPEIDYYCPGKHPFILSRGPQAVHYEHARKSLEYALQAVERAIPLIICDEILDTVLFQVLSEDRLLELAEKCKGRSDLVMTGRSPFPELLKRSDYATEFLEVKHPYYSGGRERKGFEF